MTEEKKGEFLPPDQMIEAIQKDLDIKDEEIMPELKPEDLKKAYSDNAKKGRFEIANYLLKKFTILTIDDGGARKEIFGYQEGIYIPFREVLEKQIKSILNELFTKNLVTEILTQVEIESYASREVFDEMDRDLINLENGVLRISDRTLLKHDPKYYFLYKIPVNYKPALDCPEIKKFLTQSLNKRDVPICQEWLGFSLYRYLFLKKAIIFVGRRDTGKTTFLNLMKDFLGADNTCAVSLQTLTYDKFSKISLYHKMSNIYDDLSYSDIKKNGEFKQITGRSVLRGEEKFKGSFNFISFAKLTFSCNKIPLVADLDDEAYFDRWLIVPFDIVVPKEKQDPFLEEKLNTDLELSGLLNYALEGLDRLLEAKKFSFEAEPEEVKRLMLRSEPVSAFTYDWLEESGDRDTSWLSKDDMFGAYTMYCKSNNLTPVDKKNFGKKLNLYCKFIIDSKSGNSTGWRLAKFNETALGKIDSPVNGINKVDNTEQIRVDFGGKVVENDNTIPKF